MKVSIDFSVFTKTDGAFGNITGEITTPATPAAGDRFSFAFPQPESSLDRPHDFSAVLTVVSRTMLANRSEQPVLLELTDVTVTTREEAMVLCRYFESAFGLFAILYND